MSLKNQFTKGQLDVFHNDGFVVYEDEQNQILSIVKYPQSEPKPTLLIQLDYAYRRMTIVEQNIFNFRASEPPKYCAALPDSISDTISVIYLTKSISKNLVIQLWKF